VIEEIKKLKAKRVGLQFPEGLKTHAAEVASLIKEKTGTDVFIFTDPVYGACDTKGPESKLLGLDLVVHFGHTSLMPPSAKKTMAKDKKTSL